MKEETIMKKMMMAVGFAAMVAAAGMMTFTGCDICVACSSTRGGEPDFLDCTVPKLAISPSMSFFDAMSYLEDYALNPPTMDGIDGKGRIKVEYYYGVNYIGPLGAVVETDISVRTALRDIASRAGAICGWNPERRIVTFLVKGKCHPKTWEELQEAQNEIQARDSILTNIKDAITALGDGIPTLSKLIAFLNAVKESIHYDRDNSAD